MKGREGEDCESVANNAKVGCPKYTKLRAGQEKLAENKIWMGKTRQRRVGQVMAGQVRSGQVRASLVWSDLVKVRQVRVGWVNNTIHNNIAEGLVGGRGKEYHRQEGKIISHSAVLFCLFFFGTAWRNWQPSIHSKQMASLHESNASPTLKT